MACGLTATPDLPPIAANYRASLLGRLFFVLRLLALITSLLLCVPLYYIWRILRLSNPWPRLFLKSVGWIAGARVTVNGAPIKRDVFFIANHLSWVDIPILAGVNGSAFVAQDGIASWPLIGWLCTLNDTVFVSRTNRMGVAQQINQVRDALIDCWALTVFPEGTTTDGRSLLPFKSPLLAVLDPAPPGILVQPVVLDYGRDAPDVAWVGEESAPDNAWRLFTRTRPFHVTLHFLDPIDPRDHVGRKAIAAEGRARIAARLSETLGGLPIA